MYLEYLSELIPVSFVKSRTDEDVDEPVPVIDGGLVERIEFASPWKIVIQLKNGKRIAVEPDFCSEIRYCDPDKDDDLCYLENLYLKVYRDGDGEEVEDEDEDSYG